MTRWYIEKKREHYYKEAKKFGYRSRSAFKLKQIQKKFKLINPGDIVIDLGAAPGGWSQIGKELVGDKGRVIGIDLLPIQPIENIIFLTGDLTKNSTLVKIKETIQNQQVDVVLSDMSPNISGNYSVDQARSIYLCEKALKTVDMLLKKNGHFLCKIFEGENIKEFIDQINKKFKIVKIFSPPSSRKSSSEVYIIAKYFKRKTIS